MHPKNQQSSTPLVSSKNLPQNHIEHVEVFVSCKDLKLTSSKNYFPSVALYIETGHKYVFNSETEKQNRNLHNLSFVKSFSLGYSLELKNIKLVVKGTKPTGEDKILGEA